MRDAIVSAVSRQGTDSDKFELRIPSNGNKMTRCFNVLAVYDKVDDATKIGTSGAQHTTVNHVTCITLKSIDACFAVCRMMIAILTTKDAWDAAWQARKLKRKSSNEHKRKAPGMCEP